MRRFLAVILVLIIGLISCGATVPPVMRLCVRGVDGRVACGTGTTANETPYIITAHHVVDTLEPGAQLMIRTALDTIVVNSCTVFSDQTSDIAIVRVPTQGDSLPLCSPEVGENISIYSLDKVRQGRILFATDTTIYIDAEGDADDQVIHGNSGSPVISDERQCIVGLAIAILWSQDKDGNRSKYIWSTGVSADVIMWLIKQQKAHDKARMMNASEAKEQADAGPDSKQKDTKK